MVKNMTGYQIQNKIDKSNAFNGEKEQVFESLEEARSWSESIWEGIEESENEYDDDSERTTKDDLIVVYYENGVQRGGYPLFV